MESLAELTTAGLAALLPVRASSTDGPDDASSAASVDDKLRLLAALNPLLKRLIDEIAAGIGGSAVRAALLALLAEDLARTTGRAQIVVAGKVEEADAHTLCGKPLEELHELHSRLEDFVDGTTTLPADERHRPGSKMLFKDAADFLKDRLNLSSSQAKHRLITRHLLLPRAGFNGATVAPRFEQLGKVFSDGSADPQKVAGTARRLLGLQPGIDAQQDPEETAARIESEVAESLATRNQTGTDQLLKHLESQLDAAALERSEARMDENFGLSFQGKRARGFVWELCTDVEGHELLTKVSDQLANPHSPFGQGAQETESNGPSAVDDGEPQPALPGLAATPPSNDADIIPSWAVDPAIPIAQRPRAGFTDLGQSARVGNGPEIHLLPGESLVEARERIRARNLLQAFFDSMRSTTNRERDAEGGLPARPNTEMIVTISWDSLVGKLNDPGITTHGHLVSAGYARRMACVANVIPAVLGTESQPLDLGRTQRFFSRAQRRAMALRDRGCINPGCTMAAHRCEANHIQPWYLGGKTDLANSALLCPTCHASFHAGHFKIIVENSIPYVLQNMALDPEQRLRRNWIFHPRSVPLQ